MTIRRFDTAFLLAGGALAAPLVWQAWQLHVHPQDLPSGDAAYYSAQALAFRDLALDGAWGSLLERATWPELHPPGHPLHMALWSLIFGQSQIVLRSYGAAVTMAALLVFLPLMGRQLLPRGGAAAGMLAALVMLLGPYQPTHLFTTMTEPTNLIAWLVALRLAIAWWKDERPWADLLLGAALCIATLVRYSNLPLLLLPLLAADLITRRPTPWRARSARWARWLTPTLVVLCAWLLVEPALPRAIAAFLVTAQPAKAAGLLDWLWTPWVFAERFVGSWLVAIPLLLLFASGLAPLLTQQDLGRSVALGPLTLDWRLGRPTGLALLQLTVLVGMVALSAHPYKVTRNMSALAPLLVIASLLPWLGSRLRWRGRDATGWATLAAAGALLSLQWGLQPDPTSTTPTGALARMTNDHPDHLPQPELTGLLELLEQQAYDATWLLVHGWGCPEPLLQAWAAEQALETELITRWDPTQLQVEPGAAHTAAVVLVSPPFPPKKRGERDDNRKVAALLEAAGCQRLAPRQTDHGWRLEVLRCPTPEANTARQPFTRDDLVRRELEQR